MSEKTNGMLWLMNIPMGRDANLTELERHWLLRSVTGDPKATDAYTVEELRAMGYVGLYDPQRREESGSRPAA